MATLPLQTSPERQLRIPAMGFSPSGALRLSMRFVLMVLTFIGTTVCEKAAGQQVMTIGDAIALALQYNYDIQLSRNDSSVAALDYEYRNAVFLPRLNASAGTTWNHNSQKQEFINTDNNREGNVVTNNINASVNLNWTLFDGGRMFTTRNKAEEYIRLGGLVAKEQVVNTLAGVIREYYLIVQQKQQLRAIEEQMSISQSRVDLALRKLDIGMGTRPEVLQAQVDLNAQRAARLQQQTQIEHSKKTLNQLIRPSRTGMPGGLVTEYDVVDSIPVRTDIAMDDVISQLEQSNPTLQILRKNVEIAHLSLKETKADRWPVVQFNSAYNFSRTSNNVALNPFLPIFNRNSGLNYGFTAAIPILNYRNTHRLIRQEELNIGFQQLMLENQQSLLLLDILQAYQDFEFQQRALELEESNILLARENVDIALETYRLGNMTFIQLREAQKSLEDARNRLIAARYGMKVAETELLRLKGDLIR